MATRKTDKATKAKKTGKHSDPCEDKDVLRRTSKGMYDDITDVVIKAGKEMAEAGICMKCFTAMVVTVLDEIRNDTFDALLDCYKVNMASAVHRIEELEKEAKHANAGKKRK